MPRKPLIRSSEFPYHITNRSNNRERFYTDQEDLWRIFLSCFDELRTQFQCEIHAFVLMSNHYHLMISTPRANLGEAMKYLHREVARKANRSAGRINHFFGGRYKWSLIEDEPYFWNCVKYIFRNPVRAGIHSDVRDYPFSSLNRPSGKAPWSLSAFFQSGKRKIELDVDWLNEAFQTEVEEALRKGLRRREFPLKRPLSLEVRKRELLP